MALGIIDPSDNDFLGPDIQSIGIDYNQGALNNNNSNDFLETGIESSDIINY